MRSNLPYKIRALPEFLLFFRRRLALQFSKLTYLKGLGASDLIQNI
jgi:hypothetical protein